MPTRTVQLGRIADIVSGHPHRKWPGDAQPTHRLVPIGALDPESFIIRTQDCIPVQPQSDASKAALSPGDVVLATRGDRRRAATAPPNSPSNLIASEHLAILRPRQPIDPLYLAWVLNSRGVQRQLDALSRGSYIAFVSTADVSEIRIPVPPIEDQRRIVQLSGLIHREQALCARLTSLRRTMVESLIHRHPENPASK